MKPKKVLSSMLLLIGTLALGAAPLWSQDEPRGGRPGGAVLPGSPGTIPEEMKGSPIEPRSGDETKKAQEVLKQKGHYQGSIDGVMDSKTRNALMAFQRAQGLSATGTLDDQTKKALGLPPSEEPKPQKQAPVPENRPLQEQDISPRG